MRATLFSLSLAVLCLCAAFQQPTPPEEQPAKPTPTPGIKAAIQKLTDEMQGAWVLKSIESPTIQKERRREIGYLLVADNYFSFELHISWNAADDHQGPITSLSGTHAFEIDERMDMTARQVIGSTIDDQGVVVWEQPGRVRQYAVSCLGNTLRLTREDSAVFEFERAAGTTGPRDIYGRPLKLKDPHAPKEPPREPKKKE